MSTTPTPAQNKPLPPVAIVIGVLFFLGLIGLMLFAVMRSGDAQRDALPSPLIGQRAPSFSLPVLHDPTIRISSDELAGAPYVLNVWGSWCPACAEEHPVLTRFALERSVRVVGYNWKDEPEDALRWLERFGNPYFVVITDYEGQTAIEWGIYGAPETFLVDAKGIVRWKRVGAVTDEILQEQLIPALEELEAGR